MEWALATTTGMLGAMGAWFAMVPADYKEVTAVALVGGLLVFSFKWITGGLTRSIHESQKDHREQVRDYMAQVEKTIEVIAECTHVIRGVKRRLGELEKKDYDDPKGPNPGE